MKNYTTIALSDLNAIRSNLIKQKPQEWKMRTFYLGPRLKNQRQTTRSNAVAAKIAIYVDRNLMGYV